MPLSTTITVALDERSLFFYHRLRLSLRTPIDPRVFIVPVGIVQFVLRNLRSLQLLPLPQQLLLPQQLFLALVLFLLLFRSEMRLDVHTTAGMRNPNL